MCFSALSLLLDIPIKIHEFHEAIDDVFLVVGPTLAKFKVYQRIEAKQDVDVDLIESVHNVMMCFVDLCGLCIKYNKGTGFERLVHNVKIALFDDKEVTQTVDKLKALVQQQKSIEGTLALEAVLSNKSMVSQLLLWSKDIDVKVVGIESGVKTLVEAEGSRQAEASRREQINKVRIWLGLQNTVHPSEAIQRHRMENAVPGATQWFEEMEEYKKWAAGTAPVLLFTGAESTGKSYSVSAIISRLKSSQSFPSSAKRSLVAYYIFPAEIKNDNRPVDTAVKWICMQLVEQDIAYAKRITDAIEQKSIAVKDGNCAALWKSLNIGSPMSKTTHYIIFDGLDGLPEAQMKHLWHVFRTVPSGTSENEPFEVRLLACGRHLDESVDMPWKWPTIQDQNRAGMKIYLNHHLAQKDLFPEGDQESVALCTKVAQRLLSQRECTFRGIDDTLDKIRSLVVSGGTEKDLDECLEKNIKDLGKIREQDVRRLEEELVAREINLLNELIVWVQFGYVYFTVDILNAALVRYPYRTSFYILAASLVVAPWDGTASIDLLSLFLVSY